MNDNIMRGMFHRVIIGLGIISFFSLVCCFTDKGNSEPNSEDVLVEKNMLQLDNTKVESPIVCVKLLERKMKSSEEHIKYTVTIHGVVKKITPSEIYIEVADISTRNLKKVGSTWVKDRSVVKRPPYTIGKTYSFKEKHDAFDNAVSTGLYRIFFTTPETLSKFVK